MQSKITKHSIILDGHKTSVSLEEAFWDVLKEIAKSRGIDVSALIAEIDKAHVCNNLSSAVRIFVLDHVRGQ